VGSERDDDELTAVIARLTQGNCSFSVCVWTPLPLPDAAFRMCCGGCVTHRVCVSGCTESKRGYVSSSLVALADRAASQNVATAQDTVSALALVRLGRALVGCTFEAKTDVRPVTKILVSAAAAVASLLGRGEGGVELAGAASSLLDRSSAFYKSHGDTPLSVLRDDDAVAADVAWRLGLDRGASLDARHPTGRVFRPATIHSCTDKDISVTFRGSATLYKYQRNSPCIAPRDSRSEEVVDLKAPQHAWRLALAVGSECDAMDEVKKWYRGTIKATRKKKSMTELHMHFQGWGVQYDRWIRLNSDRLAKLDTEATPAGDFGLGASIAKHDVDRVVDVDDPEDVFAVYRGAEMGCTQVSRVINTFAEHGGFAAVVKRLGKSESSGDGEAKHTADAGCNPDIAEIVLLAKAFEHSALFFTRQFAHSIVPTFVTSVQRVVLELSDSQVRHMSKNHLADVAHAVKVCMRRTSPIATVRALRFKRPAYACFVPQLTCCVCRSHRS